MQSSNVVELVTTAKSKETRRINFSNPYDVRVYAQSCIRDSKMKYSILAKKAGVCPQTVSRLASGETKDPRIGTVIRVLFSLGIRLYAEAE